MYIIIPYILGLKQVQTCSIEDQKHSLEALLMICLDSLIFFPHLFKLFYYIIHFRPLRLSFCFKIFGIILYYNCNLFSFLILLSLSSALAWKPFQACFLQKAYENRHLAKYWVRNCAPCAPTSAAPEMN